MKNSNQLKEHSKAKIELLSKYLETYLSILAKSPYINEVFIYDLFCGKGEFDYGQVGSPIKILEISKRIYFKSKADGDQIKFQFTFNDKNDKNEIEDLRQVIQKQNLFYDEIGTLNFSQKHYKKVLPEVIDDLNKLKSSQKAFVFLDPYGYKNILPSEIKKMLGNGNTEVLLFMPTHHMYRFEGNKPESLNRLIDELIDFEKDPPKRSGLNFIERLKEAFRKFLGVSYYVDTFVIEREANQLFCLFFFTSHVYGFEKMLNVKWKIDELEGRGWSKSAQGDLFSSTTQQPNTKKFEKELINFINKKERFNGEVYLFALSKGHIPKHANEILKDLQKKGLIETFTPNTEAKPPKNAFYLSYKEYKKDPKKIKITAK